MGHRVGARCIEGLVLWPVSPSALFYGKALANTVVLLIVLAVLCPLTLAIYDVYVTGSIQLFVGILLLGCSAIAAPGTLYGAITARARGSSVLLPLLLFPLIVPALIAAAKGCSALFGDDAILLEQASGWFNILVVFNLIHWGPVRVAVSLRRGGYIMTPPNTRSFQWEHIFGVLGFSGLAFGHYWGSLSDTTRQSHGRCRKDFIRART